MKRLLFAVALSAALGIVTFQAQGQNAPARGQGPAPSADPYANNPDAGKQQFPLAAPAGKDSGAKRPPLRRRRQRWCRSMPPAGNMVRSTRHPRAPSSGIR